MKIYVACLASYNNGSLVGKWIDLDDLVDLEDLETAVNNMLKKSPIVNAESFAIHAFEDFPYSLKEYTSLKDVWEIQEFCKDNTLGEALLSYFTLIDAKDMQENSYVIQADSQKGLAYEHQEIFMSDFPEKYKMYIDNQVIINEIETGETVFKYDDTWYCVYQ